MNKAKENIIQTAPCRFCGQMVQIEADEKLKNVSVLFGEDAAPEKRIGEGIVNILRAAVEEIYSGGLAKVTLNLRGALKPQFRRIAKARSMSSGRRPKSRN